MNSELPEPTPKHKAKLCFGAPYLVLRKKYKGMIISMMITTIIPIGNQSVFFSDSAERRKKTLRGSLLAGAKETT